MNQQALFTNHQKGLLYSLYIAVGSISFFVFINAAWVLYEGIIWKYTQSYVVHSALITLLCFLSAKLLLYTAYQMAHKKTNYHLGLIGCLIPLIYPIALMLLGQQPSSGDYLLMLGPVTGILFVLTLGLWKKNQ